MQADDFFTKQIRANPGESFPHLMRAIVSLANQGDLGPRRRRPDRSHPARTRRCRRRYMIRAEAWRARGDLGKALADCETVLRLDPSRLVR